jgi:hypothetical protein
LNGCGTWIPGRNRGQTGLFGKCCRIRLSRRVDSSPGVYSWQNGNSPRSAHRTQRIHSPILNSQRTSEVNLDRLISTGRATRQSPLLCASVLLAAIATLTHESRPCGSARRYSRNIDWTLIEAVFSAISALSAANLGLRSHDDNPFDCIHSDFRIIFYLKQLKSIRINVAVLLQHSLGNPRHQIFPIVLTKHNYGKRLDAMSLN